MPKSSKSCGYTGHMRIMNRKNETKTMYNSQQSQAHGLDTGTVLQHPHHKTAYPEAQCNCSSKLGKK